MDISRLYHTVRYLKPEQFYFRALYKVKGVCRKLFGIRPCYVRYSPGHPLLFKAPWIEKPCSYKGDNLFEFLNVCDTFSGVWDSDRQGELWRYNLNYMDFLLQPSMGAVEGYAWIERFIEAMPANKVANDPYPISLRGINWIKFVYLHHENLSVEQLQKIDTALYSQYLILAGRVERHLLANHYLENGFSLLFAAYYFDDNKFSKLAEKIIKSQLEEQILPDGTHFELSPMYHCIILERLLDCYSIIDNGRHKALSSLMLDKARLMLGWLQAIVMSDGNIPLLNDSALGIAPLPAELFTYAKKLGIEWSAVPLGASGYRKFNGDSYDAFVDVAALGPSYNLGHSHADTFTFVMNVCGKPFIVDTGVSTYSAGERRSYERSTRAHNTVTVDGADSSHVWGAFRCARRAAVEIISEDKCSICAKHNGYSPLSVEVYRKFVGREEEFEIVDEVRGRNGRNCTAAFHLAPDVEVISVDKEKVVTSSGTLSFMGASSVEVEAVEIAYVYNRLQYAKRISVSFDEKLTTIVAPDQTDVI